MDIKIDEHYREMIHEAEEKGCIHVTRETMRECLLKDFYSLEGIEHSYIKHIIRHNIDEENDVLIFSSCDTHEKAPFTKKELTFTKLQYENSIIPNITLLLKNSINLKTT